MATSNNPTKRARTASETQEPLLRPDNFSEDDVVNAMNNRTSVRPLASEVAGPGFRSLGGLDPVIETALENIQINISGRQYINDMNIPARSHFVVVGASGSGKTTFGEGLKTYANLYAEGRLAFYDVNDPDDDLADVFTSAKRLQPAIIYIDPSEFVLREEKHVQALLKQLDSLEKLDQVFVFCTALQLNNIARSLLAPWRLGNRLELAVPTNEARKEIFRKIVSTWSGITDPIINYVMGFTNQWNGGQMHALCKFALEAALRRSYPQLARTNGGVADTKALQTLQMTAADFRAGAAKMP